MGFGIPVPSQNSQYTYRETHLAIWKHHWYHAHATPAHGIHSTHTGTIAAHRPIAPTTVTFVYTEVATAAIHLIVSATVGFCASIVLLAIASAAATTAAGVVACAIATTAAPSPGNEASSATQ